MFEAMLDVLVSYQAFPFIAPTWRYEGKMAIALAAACLALGAAAAWLPAYAGAAPTRAWL
jgi:putative ABC transport system permease protein